MSLFKIHRNFPVGNLHALDPIYISAICITSYSKILLIFPTSYTKRGHTFPTSYSAEYRLHVMLFQLFVSRFKIFRLTKTINPTEIDGQGSTSIKLR